MAGARSRQVGYHQHLPTLGEWYEDNKKPFKKVVFSVAAVLASIGVFIAGERAQQDHEIIQFYGNYVGHTLLGQRSAVKDIQFEHLPLLPDNGVTVVTYDNGKVCEAPYEGTSSTFRFVLPGFSGCLHETPNSDNGLSATTSPSPESATPLPTANPTEIPTITPVITPMLRQ